MAGGARRPGGATRMYLISGPRMNQEKILQLLLFTPHKSLKLENERETLENIESPLSTTRTSDGHEDALQNALKRRKDLLQKLREQHLLEEFSQPYILSREHRKSYRPEPGPAYLPSALAPAPEPPRIIQHTMPQQPATIIQQLPPQAPLITQIPPPQPLPAPRSGSIKEGQHQPLHAGSDSAQRSEGAPENSRKCLLSPQS